MGRSTIIVLLVLVVSQTLLVRGQYCDNKTSYSMTFTSSIDIDISTFEKCTGATYVNVSHNVISKLCNDTFYLLWNIEILDLSYNNLSIIQPGTFRNLRQLVYLYISNNNLATLSMDFFINKLRLIKVDLSYNNITDLPLPVFNHSLPAIRDVILHHNTLTAFEPWAIAYEEDYQAIRYLDLRYNHISEFTNKYNWTYWSRTVYPGTQTDLRFNNLTCLLPDYYLQYRASNRTTEVSTMMVELMTDIRNNSLTCDCLMYPIAKSTRQSYFLYAESDLLQIYCHSPPELHGKRVLYDVRLTDFVCNVTDRCPLGCLCQERPDFGVIHVDCHNANLSTIPKKLPQNEDYTAYELILSSNQLTRIDDVGYATQLSLLRAENNLISEISAEFVEKMANKNPVLNLRNNKLTRVPRTMENIKYQDVTLEGNNFVCDCDMLWMKEWISLAPKYVDKNLQCTFERNIYKIIDLDEDILECRTIGNIILIAFLSVGLVIVISLIITAKRCPYATKVLIYKIFRIHPADRYVVDTDLGKHHDAYVAYDEDDIHVLQWVKRVLIKQLEEKKPHFRLFISARDMKPGVEAENRIKEMEKSRRLIVILSQNFHEKEWCRYEVFQAETLDKNEGRVIFILYDKHGEQLVQTEPWLSKTKDRKVFHLKEKMLWWKMRYEMPRTPVRRPKTKKVIKEKGDDNEMTNIAVLS